MSLLKFGILISDKEGLGDSFDSYDNSKYISTNDISKESELPSGGSTGSSLEVAESNSDDDDEVCDECGTSV